MQPYYVAQVLVAFSGAKEPRLLMPLQQTRFSAPCVCWVSFDGSAWFSRRATSSEVLMTATEVVSAGNKYGAAN